MSTLRKRKRHRFTTIDNTLVEDTRLRWDCKGILVYLLSKPDGWTINSNHLASQTPDGRDRVLRALKDLELFGYIRRYKERNKNGTIGWISEISEVPNDWSDKDLTDYTRVGSPDSGLADSGLADSGLADSGLADSGSSVSGLALPIVKTKSVNTESVKTELVNTHSDPDRVCEKIDFEILQPEPEPEPDAPIPALATPSPVKEVASTNSSYSSQHTSAPITNSTVVTHVHGAALAHERSFDRLPPNANFLSQLVDVYNKFKPEYWGKCTSIGSHLPRQAARLLSDYPDIESLISDWGSAILALKSNDFYNSPKFGSGNINFLLDPNKPDRVPKLAQEWRDRPQQQKEQLAQTMVAAQKGGIPRWENPDVMLTGMMLTMRRSRYAYYVSTNQLNSPDCPSIEYLQTYFPEIF